MWVLEKMPGCGPKTERRVAGAPGGWQEEYNERFSAIENCPPREDIKAAYEELMACFAEELGLGKSVHTKGK